MASFFAPNYGKQYQIHASISEILAILNHTESLSDK